jgi:hemolysin TlyA family protein
LHRSRERLDKILVERRLASTRARAQALIMAGRVHVDGNRAEKAGQIVGVDAALEISGNEIEWVSRGAYKLIRALDVFNINPAGLVCMDVGASTGGFTEVLLSRKASRVFAVDVGYGQLAWKLRNDPRVVVMERTNARFLRPEQFPGPLDLIVVDASFISLRLLLPPLMELLAPEGEMVLLIKPQFEAGRERVGKGGVIRSPEVHLQVLEEFCTFAGSLEEISLAGLTWSPIKGPSGNIEFLAHLVLRKEIERPVVDLGALVAKVVSEAALALAREHNGSERERENEP